VAYRQLLNFPLIFSGYRITIFITVIGTALNVFLLTITAYPLSKKNLRGRKAMLAFITFTMFFSGGLIPNFYLIRSLGLYNTVWSLILPGVLGAYNLILMKNFIASIPESMEESAIMDGANEISILFRIIVPLSMPAIATFIIFHSVTQWNTYFNAIIYISKRSLWPLMLIIREMVVEDGNIINETLNAPNVSTIFTLKMAGIVFSTLPILVVYPFLQKHFMKGAMIGAIKG
jgi:putative aldouronate transport system permease protein